MTDPSAQTEPLIKTVRRTCRRLRLLPPRAAVAVACSGGPDSVALLDVLVELAREESPRRSIGVCHLDHALRDGSAEDAEFVRRLAERMNLPCVVERVDVGALARDTGQSVETAGRAARYDFFVRAAARLECPLVATAHHRDDNVETVLHRLIRGAGPDGLRGVRPRRRVGESGLWVVRPMLDAARAQALRWLADRRLDHRQDPTNARLDATRNRIRHELLPMLRERFNPRVDDAVARLAETSQWLGGYLDDLAEQTLAAAGVERGARAIALDTRVLAAQNALAASQAIRLALAELGAPMGRVTLEHVRAALALADHPAPSAAIDLPGPWRARREYDRLWIERADDDAPAAGAGPIALAVGRTELPDGAAVVIEPIEAPAEQLLTRARAAPAAVAYVDAEAVVAPLTARRRREGDRFTPLGAPGARKLSDFFIDAKTPRDARSRAWLICDRRGVLWVAPHRLDARAALTGGTRRALRLTLVVD